MALTPEEIAELQRKADEADELRQRLDALAGNKNQILDEHAKAKQRLRELEDAEKARKQKELEEQGKLKELLEAARKDAEDARREAEEARKAGEQIAEQRTKERLRSDFMAAGSAEVYRPDHLWPMFQGDVSNVDGETKVVYKGSELSPGEFFKRLRNDPDYQHHFRTAKKGGMGAPAGGASAPESGDNPYLSGNVTAQILLQMDNPEQAAKLQAEAKAFMAAQAAKR